METIIKQIEANVAKAFEEAGYDAALGTVTVSNRPDLCEFQCNGAMAGAKKYGKAPIVIAEEVAARLKESVTADAAQADGDAAAKTDSAVFAKVEAVKPGFLNLTLTEDYVAAYIAALAKDKRCGAEEPYQGKKIVLDYGGPNIAKPLHVGHLRSAVIGESLKRILRFAGAEVTGDIHMGDWGLPMGLVATELRHRHPDWPYFDESFTGSYPKESLFTVAELEEVYPAASAKSKEDEAYKAEAMEATRKIQDGDKGYRALWREIMRTSKADLKKVYDRLHVSFDLWKGEADVHEIIPGMVEEMKRREYAHESDGALVIDVAEETDKKEIPPCIILKSDGAALYATTDLATIEDRMKNIRPDGMIYLTDKRQEMHFVQVFRAARKARLVLPETELAHIGFGTVNGKDGKPYKTRDGGVPRLENLLDEIAARMQERIAEGDRDLSEAETANVAEQVSLAALKYADLSNQPAKDYVFDPEKFTAFEGDTGPYLLYTIVRIKSILRKYGEGGGSVKEARIRPAGSAAEKTLQLTLTGFGEAVMRSAKELSAHGLCAFLYALSNDFNSFYHETKILTEEDEAVKAGYIALLALTLKELETGIGLLGFEAPERM
ncbi:MAG: arginine--tRNA ligase [Lachnospiraceae bacterium]|nr:arginine--tRNA ligase [Lachnospiraceae bacterium]